MASAYEEFDDGGSDLSELSEPASRPATPGNALTPRTSPEPHGRRSEGGQASAATQGEPQRRQGLTRRSSSRLQEKQGSDPSPSDEQGGPAEGSKSSDIGDKNRAEAAQKSRRDSTKHWTYEETASRNIFTDEKVEGKRERKKTERYGQAKQQEQEGTHEVGHQGEQQGAAGRRGSRAQGDSKGKEQRKPSTDIEGKAAATGAKGERDGRGQANADETLPQSAKVKINIRLKRKGTTEEAARVHGNAEHGGNDEGQAAEDEESPPRLPKRQDRTKATSSKREDAPRSRRASAISAREDLEEDKEDHPQNALRRGGAKLAKKKSKGYRRSSDAKTQQNDHSSEDFDGSSDLSDEEEAIPTSDEEEISEDERVTHSKRKKLASRQDKSKRPKVAAEQPHSRPSTLLKSKKASRPTASQTGGIPARDLAADVRPPIEQPVNVPSKVEGARPVTTPAKPNRGIPASASSTSTPVRPVGTPAKPIVRKAPGSNVLSSLLGMSSSSSRDATPVRGSAQGPRTSTGKPTSGVQPGQQKPARPDSSLAGAASSSSSATARPPLHSSRYATATRPDNPGLEGKHVTADQMAERRKIELHAHANPKGLFDLLEGAELVMEFEDETRQRLAIDPLLHKHKLYRPGRTEGMWKLVERIKENEAKKAVAAVPP